MASLKDDLEAARQELQAAHEHLYDLTAGIADGVRLQGEANAVTAIANDSHNFDLDMQRLVYNLNQPSLRI